MNKILVPVDFSDTSMNALFYAIQLFGRSDLEITALHTYGTSSSAFQMKSIDRILEEDAQRAMEALVKNVEKEEPGIVLKTKIMKGNAVSSITSLGNSGAYDFIVMGTKGASGLKEVFIGSVAGGVISKASAPVVVVPSTYRYSPLNEIVFAVSDSPISDASILEPLRRIAKMRPCKINVLHVAEEETPNIQQLLSHIEDLNPSVTYAFGTGNISQRLSDYLMKDEAGLLCLIRSKKGFFSRILNESVTLKQTFSSPVPLLILHH
jgi:nucleotide-binding universal stress UspA family protein